MLKYSSNAAPDRHISKPDVPDAIPTILLSEAETDNFNSRLETYLQTGWRIVGKLSMTETETIVNDYVVLQPVQNLPASQFSRWQH